jgi:hypothetical protein
MLCGDSSFAILFDSLIGISGISCLCGNVYSPIRFYEPVGILSGNNILGPLNGDYAGK